MEKYLNWNIGPLCDEIARLEELGKIKEALKAANALLKLLEDEDDG